MTDYGSGAENVVGRERKYKAGAGRLRTLLRGLGCAAIFFGLVIGTTAPGNPTQFLPVGRIVILVGLVMCGLSLIPRQSLTMTGDALIIPGAGLGPIPIASVQAVGLAAIQATVHAAPHDAHIWYGIIILRPDHYGVARYLPQGNSSSVVATLLANKDIYAYPDLFRWEGDTSEVSTPRGVACLVKQINYGWWPTTDPSKLRAARVVRRLAADIAERQRESGGAATVCNLGEVPHDLERRDYDCFRLWFPAPDSSAGSDRLIETGSAYS